MVNSTLTSLSEELAQVVDQAGAHVVRVEGRRRLPASGVVWSAEGLVVTAHHVIEREGRVQVGLPSGEKVPAALVGRDPTTDLALLRVEAEGLQPAEWAGPETARVGHLVLALGRPGRSVQATLGIVSALGEAWRTPAGGHVDRFLQTDVVMYPGFSGGPLVDSRGRALGVNTSALLRGISLTVPTPTVRRVVEALRAHGRVRQGYLGVGVQPARLPERLAEAQDQETALLVNWVEPGGPADQGGVLVGDLLLALEGEPLRAVDDLLAALSGDRVGRQVALRVLRGGRVEELSLRVGERG